MGFFTTPGGAAAISAGGGLVSGLVNNLFAGSAARKQHQREKELMDLENQYAIDMFNRTNAYNTPSQQMKRLREAGLNPNLMYGNGSASTGNADMPSAPSSGTAAKAEYPGIENMAAEAYHAYSNALQYEATEANTAKVNAERLAVLQNTRNAQIDELIKLEKWYKDSRDNMIGDATYYDQIQQVRKNLAKTDSEIESIKTSTSEASSRRALNEKQLNVLDSVVELNGAKKSKILAEAYRAELENANFSTFLDEVRSRTGLNDRESQRAALAAVLSGVDAAKALLTGSSSDGVNAIIDRALTFGISKIQGMSIAELQGLFDSLMTDTAPPSRNKGYNK